jgi:SAM-dependent MidA family methyltransferase
MVGALQMGTSIPAVVAPEFLAAFHARARELQASSGEVKEGRDEPGSSGAVISFAEFMALALYHERVGYYRRGRRRVGRDEETDFYTATTLGPVFGELVVAACVRLLGGEEAAARHTWVEIGAEPSDHAPNGRVGGGVLAGVEHPFADVRTVRVGEPLTLAGACVVFSNELLDAQPLRRYVRRDGAWRELGVAWCGQAFAEVELAAGGSHEAWLPTAAPEGYRFDAPRAAVALVGAITAQPWHGLWVAFDYGKSFAELATATPAGTARAYYRHTQSNELLVRPGEQDLTGHVCWDWLTAELAAGGFAEATVESQEAFFVRHAADWLEHTLATEATTRGPGRRARAIMQLLHPAQMGQKFQILHARRAGPAEAGEKF